MLKRIATACFIVLVVSVCPALARAQWTIHAIAGKMRVVNVSSKTLIIDTNDGSVGLFELPKNDKVKVSFDKDVRAETVTPEQAVGDTGQVIVFFFDDGDTRTAIAVQSIGTGTFDKKIATVLNFNKHDHLLTVQTDSGEHQTLSVTDKTIVDTPDGVVTGRKFNAQPGDHLRLLVESKDGAQQILLVRLDGNRI